MKTSTICHRACLVAAGVLVVALASTTPSLAAAAGTAGGCCDRSAGRPASTQPQDPYLHQQPSPLGFQGLASPEQNAEEGTLGQGAAQVDAEVGAGDHDLVDVATSAPQHSARGGWVVQGVGILLFLAVVSMSIHWIFRPSDQIPRIGGGSRSDG
jgi:hypothetical protein